MRKNFNFIHVLMLAFIFGSLAGCTDKDPARSVHILSRPPTQEKSAVDPNGDSRTDARDDARGDNRGESKIDARKWQPETCRTLKPLIASDVFGVSGPCPYQLHERVSCRVAGDDLYVFLKKSFSENAQFSIMLNVEHYKGPGEYKGARLFVLLHEGESGYRWSNIDVKLKVGPDESYVDIPATLLAGEPAKRSCHRLSGARWNYKYSCSSASESLNAIESTIETASGRIGCLEHKPKPAD